MAADGKRLENLVRYIEEQLLPPGFTIESNVRTDDESVGAGEFDLIVSGRLGSLDVKWLIECRDRPSAGPAPSAWIQQLDGRRRLFGFDAVTAVSTTGFSSDALSAARHLRISTREVRDLKPEGFSHWLQVPFIVNRVRNAALLNAAFLVASTTTPEQQAALKDVVSAATGQTPLLKKRNGDMVTPVDAFLAALDMDESLRPTSDDDGQSRPVHIKAQFKAGKRFTIDTALGEIEVECIRFSGSVTNTETLSPIEDAVEYLDSLERKDVSQVVTFTPSLVHGKNLRLEFHRLPDDQGTDVIIRVMPD